MRSLILSILCFIFVLPSTVSAQNKEPNVKGVKVGTHFSTVIKKLGKPLSIKKGGTFPCDGEGEMVTTRYEGLVLEFIKSNLDKKLFVASVEVTSPKWSVFGIRVGARLRDVKTKFRGKLLKFPKENGFDVFDVSGGFYNEGFSGFYFKNERLVKISWEFNIC